MYNLFASKIKKTSDDGLVTHTAIETRIKELGMEIQTPMIAARIRKLKARLPKDPNALVKAAENYNAALCAGKRERLAGFGQVVY